MASWLLDKNMLQWAHGHVETTISTQQPAGRRNWLQSTRVNFVPVCSITQLVAKHTGQLRTRMLHHSKIARDRSLSFQLPLTYRF